MSPFSVVNGLDQINNILSVVFIYRSQYLAAYYINFIGFIAFGLVRVGYSVMLRDINQGACSFFFFLRIFFFLFSFVIYVQVFFFG